MPAMIWYFSHIPSYLRIMMIGQAVRMATLDPDGHVTFKNDKGEELSLDIARTPRLVKYGEELSKYGEKFS